MNIPAHEPVRFDPNNPAHDPADQLRYLANGISRAFAMLATDARGDRTMQMPEWVLRQWMGYVTLVAQAIAAQGDDR